MIFCGSSYRIAYPVTAGAFVSQVLDREAFRRHCDQYRTQAEILKCNAANCFVGAESRRQRIRSWK